MPVVPDTATLLKEAKAAYHELLTGQAAVVLVDSNGERVEYRPANVNQLRSYIRDLEAQLGTATPSGPMRLVF